MSPDQALIGLIVADIALRAGLFSVPGRAPSLVGHLYSAIIMTAIVTTVVTPIGLRRLMLRSE